MTSGAVLVGHHRVGGGLEIGGYAALQVPRVRLGMSLMHLPTDDGLETPVRSAEGTFCVIAAPFAICADGRAPERESSRQ